MSEVVFITGTGTGVGKTVLTALLLHHLRSTGRRALALKPFCSGGRGDARLLLGLQKGAITLDEVNPFYFPKPLAPWVAQNDSRKPGPKPAITMPRVLKALHSARKNCDTLLIEGSGGIFVPLSPRMFVADLITEIADRVIVVAPNALGTINHTLLTVNMLRSLGIESINVVLMAPAKPDISAAVNPATLRHFLGAPVFEFPFLGEDASTISSVKKNVAKLRSSLAELAGF